MKFNETKDQCIVFILNNNSGGTFSPIWRYLTAIIVPTKLFITKVHPPTATYTHA